jgi:hypothetical protein
MLATSSSLIKPRVHVQVAVNGVGKVVHACRRGALMWALALRPAVVRGNDGGGVRAWWTLLISILGGSYRIGCVKYQ